MSPVPTRGAVVESDGVRFRVWSSCAERVSLCLHDEAGPESRRIRMNPLGDGDWEIFVPGCQPGQRYGFRVDGPWDPDAGQRCNPHKLLLDPYARLLDGAFHWSAAVFDYTVETAHTGWRQDERDSAPVVPRSVVTPSLTPFPSRGALRAWNDAVVYELNVRGYTMSHPELSEAERGRLKGLSNGEILGHLKALGVTSVELMPVHAFLDERHLAERGLRNLWGYNSIGFFAVEPRLAGAEPIAEFRAMVTALHEAGFEVLLDVVYNHTAEGGGLGPTLAFRGLDNLAYYRVDEDDPAIYRNLAGTGNTINADHPVVQELVVDSLRYWHRDMGVDGFRFDIAPVLGHNGSSFDPNHPLLQSIGGDPVFSDARFIAEPWGPESYELGRFPAPWSEWNDRFRDSLRRFWRRDDADLSALAQRVHGSADLFDTPGRGPTASVNFVTAHDGFTLNDLVSYARRHNEANGEGNRDGHGHNYSTNHGEEGPTDRRAILALRRRHRLNLLATLLFSQGVPMVLGGDEFGNGQGGNNNAYAQDNETGWVDWSGLDEDPEFFEVVREFVALRRAHPLLRRPQFAHGAGAGDLRDVDWLHPEGRPMATEDWSNGKAVLKLLGEPGDHTVEPCRLALVINGDDREVSFKLPGSGRWRLETSTDRRSAQPEEGVFQSAAWSVALLIADS